MTAKPDQVLTKCFARLRRGGSACSVVGLTVLRRTGRRRGTTYSLGGIVFDAITRQALAHGRRMDLTRREAALLEEFLRVPGQVITKALLEDRLYALEDSGSINALEAAVSRLRRKLVAVKAALRIETKWGIGYRLVEAAPEEGHSYGKVLT